MTLNLKDVADMLCIRHDDGNGGEFVCNGRCANVDTVEDALCELDTSEDRAALLLAVAQDQSYVITTRVVEIVAREHGLRISPTHTRRGMVRAIVADMER